MDKVCSHLTFHCFLFAKGFLLLYTVCLTIKMIPINLLYRHVCSVYVSAHSPKLKVFVPLCVFVLAGVRSWGIGCVHLCIDAITLSSAYLTAQTFLSSASLLTPVQPFKAIFHFLMTCMFSLFRFFVVLLNFFLLFFFTVPSHPLVVFFVSGQYCECWGFSSCSF